MLEAELIEIIGHLMPQCRRRRCIQPQTEYTTRCLNHYLSHKYSGMKQRCRKQPSYRGRIVEMARAEFIEWGLLTLPVGMDCASIDRIDNNKGYSLDNMQWLEWRENSRQENKGLAKDQKKCSMCKEVLHTSQFYNSGDWHYHRCRACSWRYDHELDRQKRENDLKAEAIQ